MTVGATGATAGTTGARQDVPPPPDATADPATPLAFVEIDAARTSPWIEEPLAVTLRFGVAAELVDEGLLQLFQARLDVPVHVSIAELASASGALVEVVSGTDPRDASFALDDAIARARRVDDRTREGTRFSTWQVPLRVLATSPGRLVLAAPSLRFAWATRFGEGFVDGRVALDRREGLVTGEPLVLDVRPLPDEGRPPGFAGAVGRFRIDASVEPREVRVGESVKLELAIAGEGNHGRFDAPELARVAGFRVLGRLVEREPGRLVATYDLAPLDERVTGVPPVELATFDPGPEPGWAVLATPAIPIRVLPARSRDGSAARTGATDAGPGVAPERAPSRSAGARRGAVLAFAAVAGCTLALGALIVRARVRARRRADRGAGREHGG